MEIASSQPKYVEMQGEKLQLVTGDSCVLLCWIFWRVHRLILIVSEVKY